MDIGSKDVALQSFPIYLRVPSGTPGAFLTGLRHVRIGTESQSLLHCFIMASSTGPSMWHSGPLLCSGMSQPRAAGLHEPGLFEKAGVTEL